MSVTALSRCVGDVDSFWDKHWAIAPLLLHAEGRSFDDLASYEDLDRMISSLGLRAGNLRMVKDGNTLASSAYTTRTGGSRSLEASVSAPLVYERFSEGATIVLESLHRYWEPLTDFCRELELALGHRLQVNAYITPPGSQGFDVHRDDHDVFVLQVWGEKHWTVLDREDDEVVIIDEPVLRGDALYIPKGFPHSARTGEGTSAHLTVGILTHKTLDVFKELMKLAEGLPAFQRRLDPESTSDVVTLRRAVQQSVDELRDWLNEVDIEELTGRVARKVKSTAQPLLRGQLRQLELLSELGARSSIRRRTGATCFLSRRDPHLVVVLPDRELQMPLIAEGAMRLVAERAQFTVSDLHLELDPDSALVLVKRLIREGLLEVVIDD